MTFVRRFCLVVVFTLLAVPTLAAPWPHPRGPGMDGRLVDTEGFAAFDEVDEDTETSWHLAPAWTTALGSGYSGLIVVDGLVITSFSEGDADWTAAFDAATGVERWRRRLGPRTLAHDGSEDGPISSPVSGHGLVFTLHPLGALHALRVATGDVVWTTHVAADLKGRPSDFDFTVTPAVVDDVLVLPIGGADGRAIAGLEVATGTLRWTSGEGQVLHQSPTVMTLGGRVQVVAVTAAGLFGIDPAQGDVLWRHGLPADDRAHPTTVSTALGDDRFLVRMNDDMAAFRVLHDDHGWRVQPLFRTAALGRTFAPPVLHDGHLYGFRGGILTCVDAETGGRVWRSREPGGDGLVVVGDQLVIFAANGHVVTADASPAGYHERARLKALAASSLTWPSVADGRIFVRNLESLAAIQVTADAPATADPSTSYASTAGASPVDDNHAFARWLHEAAASPQPQEQVEQLWQKHETLPIVDGEHLTFLFRAQAEDVAMAGSMLDDGAAVPLHRLEGTDLFYRTFTLPPGGRWEYRFQVDYEGWIIDPKNPRTVPAYDDDDPFSEVVTPGYRRAHHLEPPTGPRGRIEVVAVPALGVTEARQVAVWLPPGYEKGKERYPVLVVHDGEAWLERGHLHVSLDNLVGRSVAPVIVAFVRPAQEWWAEAGGDETEAYAQWQAETLIPTLNQRYRLRTKPGAHATLGHRSFGVAAAVAALRHPTVFGQAALISPGLGLGYREPLEALIRANDTPHIRFHVDWNRFDERRSDRGFDFGRDAEELATLLRASGYPVTGGEHLDSVGWGGWRNRNDLVLEALFPRDR